MNDQQNMTPMITIGVTCFNAENTIESAVRSAQEQDWPNLEILIVDDGSTDRSVEIIRKIAVQDDRIRLVCHEKNKGTATTRNSILRHAKGEYISFFDDDDISKPDRLTKQYRRIVEYNKKNMAEIIFCYTNRSVIKPGENSPVNTYYAIGRQSRVPNGSSLADFLLWHYEDPEYSWGHVGSCTLMFHRDAISKVGDFDERFRRCAEWDWAIRAAFQGAHFISVNEPLVIQRITCTEDKSGKIPLYYTLLLRKKYKGYLKKKHVYLASITIAYVRFYYARGCKWRSRFSLLLSCICAPHLVLVNEWRKYWQRKKYLGI